MLFRVSSCLRWCKETGAAVEHWYGELIKLLGFVGELTLALGDAVRRPHRIKWRSFAFYLDSCGSGAMPIIALLGTLIGVILAFQALEQLSRYGAAGYVSNLVGTVIITELGPLMTAVVLAGRSGSAFAAELGSMKVREEIDALTTMGLPTGRFLLVPKVLALLVALPGLNILACVCGVFGGMLVIIAQVNISAIEYYYKVTEVVRVADLAQGLLKSVIFGLIVAAVGCMKGLEAPRDAQGVGRAATSAIVMAIFLIIVVDAIITAIFSM